MEKIKDVFLGQVNPRFEQAVVDKLDEIVDWINEHKKIADNKTEGMKDYLWNEVIKLQEKNADITITKIEVSRECYRELQREFRGIAVVNKRETFMGIPLIMNLELKPPFVIIAKKEGKGDFEER